MHSREVSTPRCIGSGGAAYLSSFLALTAALSCLDMRKLAWGKTLELTVG